MGKENSRVRSPTALAAGLAAYGLSEQLWGLQHKKINATEFIDAVEDLVWSAILEERERSMELADALKPFSDAVYNDNGDVFVSHCCTGEYMKAKRVYTQSDKDDRVVCDQCAGTGRDQSTKGGVYQGIKLCPKCQGRGSNPREPA